MIGAWGAGSEAISLIGFIILLGIICLFIAAIFVPKTTRGKWIAVSLVLAPVIYFYVQVQIRVHEVKKIQQANELRTEQARAIFEERCKKAGVFIHRTAENVDGVFLMKVRQSSNLWEKSLEDPYGQDTTGDGYIQTFLAGRNAEGVLQIMQGYVNTRPVEVTRGYRIVDAIDPKDGQRYRYWRTVVMVPKEELLKDQDIQGMIRKNPDYKVSALERFVLAKEPAAAPFPRYGVTYEDISTPEEREYWVAGSSLKVIDLTTNEVMAERVGYMFDPAQGRDGWGDPWRRGQFNACPAFEGSGNYRKTIYQTRDFVEQVLHPKQENE